MNYVPDISVGVCVNHVPDIGGSVVNNIPDIRVVCV